MVLKSFDFGVVRTLEPKQYLLKAVWKRRWAAILTDKQVNQSSLTLTGRWTSSSDYRVMNSASTNDVDCISTTNMLYADELPDASNPTQTSARRSLPRYYFEKNNGQSLPSLTRTLMSLFNSSGRFNIKPNVFSSGREKRTLFKTNKDRLPSMKGCYSTEKTIRKRSNKIQKKTSLEKEKRET